MALIHSVTVTQCVNDGTMVANTYRGPQAVVHITTIGALCISGYQPTENMNGRCTKVIAPGHWVSYIHYTYEDRKDTTT